MSRLRLVFASIFALSILVLSTAACPSRGAPRGSRQPPPHRIVVAQDYRLTAPVVIAAEEHEPDELLVDAEYVWWAAGKDVRRARRSGGAAETFAAGIGPITNLAQDDTHIFVATEGLGHTDDTPLGSGRLLAIAKADGKQQIVLATGLVDPNDIAVPLDGDDIYYAHSTEAIDFDVETGQLFAVSRRGQGKPRVLVDKQASPHQLAVDASHVYWTNYGGNLALSRVPRQGGPVELLASGLGTPTGLALGVDDVFVTAMYGAGLARIPKAGGQARSLLGGTGLGVVVDNGQVLVRIEAGMIVALPETPPAGVAAATVARVVALDQATFFEPLGVAGDELYFSSRGEGMIRRTSRAGGLLLLAQLGDTPGAVATDADFVYVLDTDNGVSGDVVTTPLPDRVWRIPRDGGGATLRFSTGEEEELTGIAVDATHIYLLDAGLGAVLRLAKSGEGKPETVVTGLHAPLALVALAVDDTHVYFADGEAGTIGRAPLAGGKEERLVERLVERPGAKITALAITADALLWAERTGARTIVYRSRKQAGDQPVVVTTVHGSEVFALTSDTAYLLTSVNDQPSTLSTVTLADGVAHAIEAPRGEYGGLAVSGDSLVFTSVTYQAVMRLTR